MISNPNDNHLEIQMVTFYRYPLCLRGGQPVLGQERSDIVLVGQAAGVCNDNYFSPAMARSNCRWGRVASRNFVTGCVIYDVTVGGVEGRERSSRPLEKIHKDRGKEGCGEKGGGSPLSPHLWFQVEFGITKDRSATPKTRRRAACLRHN